MGGRCGRSLECLRSRWCIYMRWTECEGHTKPGKRRPSHVGKVACQHAVDHGNMYTCTGVHCGQIEHTHHGYSCKLPFKMARVQEVSRGRKRWAIMWSEPARLWGDGVVFIKKPVVVFCSLVFCSMCRQVTEIKYSWSRHLAWTVKYRPPTPLSATWTQRTFFTSLTRADGCVSVCVCLCACACTLVTDSASICLPGRLCLCPVKI